MSITTRERRLLLTSSTLSFHLTTDSATREVSTLVRGWDITHKTIVEVEFDHTVVDHYNGHGENLNGFVHVIGGGVSDEFTRTWLNTLRGGSMLRAKWVRNNSSPVLDSIGWVCDEFSLSTYDPEGRNGKSFFISKYVGPDNSARMTRLSN